MGQKPLLCEFRLGDIETFDEADMMQHLGAAWRILHHVFGGGSPQEENIECRDCYELLVAGGLNKGVATPTDESANTFEEYVGRYMDELTKVEDPKVAKFLFAQWFASCPLFWRKQFAEHQEALDDLKGMLPPSE